MGKRRILVIGGAGYLGSVLCRKLLDRGHNVRVLDSMFYGRESIRDLSSNPDFEIHTGDIRNLQTLAGAIRDCDDVVHLAAIVGAQACGLDERTTVETNYLSTGAILEICRRNDVDRFVFASTCSVYGATEGTVSEQSATNPLELYARTKLDSESIVLRGNSDQLRTTVLRMATIFGLSYRMRFDLVVNLLTAKASTERLIPIFGGQQWRPFIHVRNAADAYVRCLENGGTALGGEIINIGYNSLNLQIAEVGEIIHECIPEAALRVEEGGDKRDYRIDFSKAERLLALDGPITIKEAVVDLNEEFKRGSFSDWRAPRYSNFQKGIEDYYRSLMKNGGGTLEDDGFE